MREFRGMKLDRDIFRATAHAATTNKIMNPIETIDHHYLGIPRSIASFLIETTAGLLLIEAGPGSTLPQLEAGLARHGVRLRDIQHLVLTHIHLDHAGAAGRIAREGAMVYVHHFGVKHLVDPTKLIDSATRIYGDQMDRLWGPMEPVPSDHIRAVHDNDVLRFGDTELRAIETPGHARHHHAYALNIAGEKLCFVGDAAGICVLDVPPAAFIAVPTPPPEFDLDAWLASINRLDAEAFDAIYLTHYGKRHDAPAHFAALRKALREEAAFIEHKMNEGCERNAIVNAYMEMVRIKAIAAGITSYDVERYVSTNLLTMNVDGIIRWLTKRTGVRGNE